MDTTALLNIPTKTSSDGEWLEWYKLMKSSFGKKTARIRFVNAWNKRGGKDSTANTNNLRTEMEKDGVVIESGVIGTITDFGVDVVDGISDAFSIGKYATITIGVILVAGLAMIVYGIAKQPLKLIESSQRTTLEGGKAFTSMKGA